MGKKWNTDLKPAQQLLSLYHVLVFGRKEISLTELSKELGCSKQSVRRLVDQLEDSCLGRVLCNKRGREAVYSMDRPRTRARLTLDADGLRQLMLCRDFMRRLLPESMRQKMDSALDQASAYMPEGDEDLLSLGVSLSKGRIDYSPFQDILQTAMDAIRKQSVCEVTYSSSRPEKGEESFDFAPKRLVSYREVIYIRGWAVTASGRPQIQGDSPRLLALQRVKSLTITRRGGDHLPDATDEAPGAFGVMDGEPFQARIRFSPEAAAYVSERRWSEEQVVTRRRDGGVTLRLTARSRPELISWILGFGDAAEALSPKWLRDELGQKTALLSERYAAALAPGDEEEDGDIPVRTAPAKAARKTAVKATVRATARKAAGTKAAGAKKAGTRAPAATKKTSGTK